METPVTSEMSSPPFATPPSDMDIPINLESTSDMEMDVDTSEDSNATVSIREEGSDGSRESARSGRERPSTPIPGRPELLVDSSFAVSSVLARWEERGFDSNAVWNKAEGNILSDLHNSMVAHNISQEVTNMGPFLFTKTFFTTREPSKRRGALRAILERILPSDQWTEKALSLSSTFDVFVFVCKQWGIENERGAITGVVSPKENFAFWMKALKVMEKLRKFPKAAKAMLEYEFRSDETKITWEQAVDNAVVAAQSMTCCVTLKNVASMESLMTKQMEGKQGAKFLRKLISGVKREIDGEEVNHDEKSCPSWYGHSKCVQVHVTGTEFLDNAEPYTDYMEHNRCFEDRKMEFIVFQSEYADTVVANLLKIHGEFLKALTSLKLGDEEDKFDLKFPL